MTIQTFCRAALVAIGLFAVSAASHAEWTIGVSVGVPPPALPVYEQPPIPAAGYLWTPGYWAYSADDEDYYWVPGTWVLAPRPGYLWTPGYWAADGAYFAWRAGYWGPEVGFYGGINYGFGYFGIGFGGGYWRGDEFCYNRAVTNVSNVSVTNVYNNTTIVNNQITSSRVSYNGGEHGVRAQPRDADRAVAHAPHLWATREQSRHELAARSLPALRAAVNHGQPPIAATPRPAKFADFGPAARAARSISTPRDMSHATRERVGRGAERVQANTGRDRSTSASPNSSARLAASQPRQATNAPPADRAARANRDGAQFARRPATIPSVVVAHGAEANRTGQPFGYRQGPRADYPSAHAPAQRWASPTPAAPDRRYGQREMPHAVNAQREAIPPRAYRSAPSPSTPHPGANVASPRTYTAQHGGSDSTRHGPGRP